MAQPGLPFVQTLAARMLPGEYQSCSISDSSPLLAAARAAAQAPGNLCSAKIKPGSSDYSGKEPKSV